MKTNSLTKENLITWRYGDMPLSWVRTVSRLKGSHVERLLIKKKPPPVEGGGFFTEFSSACYLQLGQYLCNAGVQYFESV